MTVAVDLFGTRRGFLRAAGTLAAAWALGGGRTAAGAVDDDPGSLLAMAPSRAGWSAIGTAYLDAHPDERDVRRLAAALRADAAPPRDGELAAVRQALRARIRAEFGAGEVVVVRGWMLARSEARLAALVALAPGRPMIVQVLNHASVIVESDGLRLLSDPWYNGTAFSGAWALRWHNPAAFDHAVQCTHLWISHLHSDHLHEPTLRRLAARAPHLHVLTGDAASFAMTPLLRAYGFANVTPLPERAPIPLGGRVTVTRYPATSIDNMLLIDTPGGRLLNYNDCNLPLTALARLRRRMAPIDVVLAAFAPGRKLLRGPSSAAAVRTRFGRAFCGVVDALAARWAVPFAAGHAWRAPEAVDGDPAITAADLAADDGRVLAAAVGEAIDFSDMSRPQVHAAVSPPAPNPRTPLDYGASLPLDDAVAAAADFCRGVRAAGLGWAPLLPPLHIDVHDLAVQLVLHPAGARLARPPRSPAHLRAHSRSLSYWFTAPFGSDGFSVGGRFDYHESADNPLARWLLCGVLRDHRVDPRTLLLGLHRPQTWRFLWNRREELAAVLRHGGWAIGRRS